MDCVAVSRENLAEKYLAGDLAPGQQEAYERHYFECDTCFRELERLTAIREALSETRVERPLPRQRARRTPLSGWRWPALAALAASVVGAAVLRLAYEPAGDVAETSASQQARSTGPPQVTSPATTPAATVAAAGPASPAASDGVAGTRALTRSQWLTRLARTDPPQYSPSILRGAYDDASQSFRKGMKFYVNGDYAAALPLLRQATGMDPTRADIAFFLAASELMRGNFAAAQEEFGRVIALGETPFTQEAHFYLAKAFAGRGDIEAARDALSVAIALDGAVAGRARQMLSSLDELSGSGE